MRLPEGEGLGHISLHPVHQADEQRHQHQDHRRAYDHACEIPQISQRPPAFPAKDGTLLLVEHVLIPEFLFVEELRLFLVGVILVDFLAVALVVGFFPGIVAAIGKLIPVILPEGRLMLGLLICMIKLLLKLSK